MPALSRTSTSSKINRFFRISNGQNGQNTEERAAGFEEEEECTDFDLWSMPGGDMPTDPQLRQGLIEEQLHREPTKGLSRPHQEAQ